MRWDDSEESDNVEDRRGEAPSGGGGFGFGGGSIGIGTIVVALIGSWVLGVNPLTLLGLLSGGGGANPPVVAPAPTRPAAGPPQAPSDETGRFVARVLRDTEVTWTQIFAERGGQYERPKLDLFTGAIDTACGLGRSAAGPFYCPGDRKVYIDLQFYRMLRERFHAPGEFAEAYVIAHEVGHHVQNLLGISAKLDAMRGRVSATQYNALSVRLELQADCFAGIWGYHADRDRHRLEPGEVEEALRAASAIGDDTLQKQAQGYAVPESFTHGTSEQRVRWFQRGYQSGALDQCDTFKASAL